MAVSSTSQPRGSNVHAFTRTGALCYPRKTPNRGGAPLPSIHLFLHPPSPAYLKADYRGGSLESGNDIGRGQSVLSGAWYSFDIEECQYQNCERLVDQSTQIHCGLGRNASSGHTTPGTTFIALTRGKFDMMNKCVYTVELNVAILHTVGNIIPLNVVEVEPLCVLFDNFRIRV